MQLAVLYCFVHLRRLGKELLKGPSQRMLQGLANLIALKHTLPQRSTSETNQK